MMRFNTSPSSSLLANYSCGSVPLSYLDKNNITAMGCSTISTSRWTNQLTCLDLSKTSFIKDGTTFLIRAACSCLREIFLSWKILFCVDCALARVMPDWQWWMFSSGPAQSQKNCHTFPLWSNYNWELNTIREDGCKGLSRGDGQK